MTSVAEVQSLLRFLKDAKVPIPLAISKVQELKRENLTDPQSLAKAPLPKILAIFQDEKLAKQVLSTAKRVSKKRTSSSTSVNSSSPKKKAKYAASDSGAQLSPADFEASLALPSWEPSNLEDVEIEINKTVLYTNRAPLVVAFVVQLLKYTMPSQPLSSRLSLAQAVMSMGAKSKALNLGIQSGTAAEDEGWGKGQPVIKVMGRSIKVMRRWGYDEQQTSDGTNEHSINQEQKVDMEKPPKPDTDTEHRVDIATQETIKADSSPRTKKEHPSATSKAEPPLWALDLDALKKSNASPLIPSTAPTSTIGPIYDPHTAKTYLLKSFATPSPSPSPAKPTAPAKEREQKEYNLARLLYALDLLYASWIDVIGPEELDRRAFGWYMRVRPQVEDGVKGWGGKGEVRLEKLMGLRR